MNPIQKKPLPIEQLQALGVGVVYLFGSHAERHAGPGSDIDVAVVLIDPHTALPGASTLYNKLYDIFTDVFDMSGFKTIDIVLLRRAPLELQFDVISHGAVLYEVSSEFRLAYEDRIEMLYCDFKPKLDMFNRAVLERV